VEVATALDITFLKVPWDANAFGRHSDVPLYVHMSDLLVGPCIWRSID